LDVERPALCQLMKNHEYRMYYNHDPPEIKNNRPVLFKSGLQECVDFHAA
jgi:hypothetical protein